MKIEKKNFGIWELPGLALYHITVIFFQTIFCRKVVIYNIKSHVISASIILPNKSYYDKLTILAEQSIV